MEDHVYKIIELASSSNESIDDAVRKGVARAAETLENLRWFEVKEMRGHIEGGEIAHYQVVLRIGFTLNERLIIPNQKPMPSTSVRMSPGVVMVGKWVGAIMPKSMGPEA